MALNAKTIAEIQRKAEKGISLVSATPEKQKLYNQYQETIRKAKSGQNLVSSTPDKQALYDKYAKSVASKPSNTQTVKTPAVNQSNQNRVTDLAKSYQERNNNYSNSVYNPVKKKAQDYLNNRQQDYKPSPNNQFDRNPSNPYSLKTGVYNDQSQAQKLLDKFAKDYGASNARLIQDEGGWRVFGDFDDLQRANKVGKRIQDLGIAGVTHVVQNTGSVPRQDLSYNIYSPDDPRYFQDLPNASADALAGFTGSNLDEFSGMYAKGNEADNKTYQPLTHSEAFSVNPLHGVNASRQALIKQALESGDWTKYWNYEADQSPMHFEQGQDGNFKQNKNYYANLIESAYEAMTEAQMSGDTQKALTWQRNLQERINEYNNAPGMSVYIPRINSTDSLAQQYGILAPDENYIESEYNNPLVRTDGITERRMWYDNPYYQDNPELIQLAINSANQHLTGGARDAANKVNQGYIDALMSFAPNGSLPTTSGQGAPNPSAQSGGGVSPSAVPTSSGQFNLSYESVADQMKQQLDPIYQRAVENIKKEQYQNELDASQVSSKRGLAHSGLAADQQNKLAIASQGQVADLDAQRAAQIAEMAQAQLNRNYDLDYRERQFDYQAGRDQVMDGRWQQQFDYQSYRDAIQDMLNQRNFDYQTGRDQVSDDRWQQQWEYQKEQEASERAWREYTYNNMSASEKAQLEWAKAQYGEEAAWRMYQLQYEGELSKSQSQAEIDFYKNAGFLTP